MDVGLQWRRRTCTNYYGIPYSIVGEDLHTTHPVLAQVWRHPERQANLARLLRNVEIHALDNAMAVGRKLADSETSDIVDAHLVVVAELLGTFVLTGDPDDMMALNARFETY